MDDQKYELRYKYVHENEEDRGGAKTPFKGSPLAAGYDLFAAAAAVVPAKG